MCANGSNLMLLTVEFNHEFCELSPRDGTEFGLGSPHYLLQLDAERFLDEPRRVLRTFGIRNLDPVEQFLDFLNPLANAAMQRVVLGKATRFGYEYESSQEVVLGKASGLEYRLESFVGLQGHLVRWQEVGGKKQVGRYSPTHLGGGIKYG